MPIAMLHAILTGRPIDIRDHDHRMADGLRRLFVGDDGARDTGCAGGAGAGHRGFVAHLVRAEAGAEREGSGDGDSSKRLHRATFRLAVTFSLSRTCTRTASPTSDSRNFGSCQSFAILSGIATAR